MRHFVLSMFVATPVVLCDTQNASSPTNMRRCNPFGRGTAAQNNNFTGLAGEITMDTDAKTLRVHDGETLGGFALARADADAGTGDFDIASVSDEFWTSLFARFGGATAPSIMVSPQ